MNLTEEQQTILEHFKNNTEGKYSINATAGSGKTFLSFEIAKILEDKDLVGLYLVFNRLNAKEGKAKQQKLQLNDLEVRTYHSFALKIIQSFLVFSDTKPIKTNLSISDLNTIYKFSKLKFYKKLQILQAFNTFCSIGYIKADLDIELKRNLKLLMNYIVDVENDFPFPISFTIYLASKLLTIHKDNIPEKLKVDYLIVDEFGDLSKLDIDFITNIKTNLFIAIGDKYQNIYYFRTQAFNPFKAIQFDKNFTLTQSFRVHKDIALEVEQFGKEYLEPNFKFKGTDNPKNFNSEATIVGTNSGIILTIYNLHLQNINYQIRTKLEVNKLIQDLELAVRYILLGNKVLQNNKVLAEDYKFLLDYRKEHFNYTLNIPNAELSSNTQLSFFEFLVKYEILKFHNQYALIKLVEEYKNNPQLFLHISSYLSFNEYNPKIMYVLTAFTTKGLEFTNTYINTDFTQYVFFSMKHVIINYIKKYSKLIKKEKWNIDKFTDTLLTLEQTKAYLYLIFVAFTRASQFIYGDKTVLDFRTLIGYVYNSILNDKKVNSNVKELLLNMIKGDIDKC